MRTFRSLSPQQDPAQLPGFLRSLQASIEQAANRANPKDALIYLHAAPARIDAGDLVLADGTDWNPGSGAGLYLRNEANTAWLCIGSVSKWAAYTPTVTSTTGSFTTVSGAGRYKQIGKTAHFSVSVSITTIGTAGTAVDVTLPVTAASPARFVFSGRENAVTGTMLMAFFTSTTNLQIKKYDNTFIGADGYLLVVSGSYEAA